MPTPTALPAPTPTPTAALPTLTPTPTAALPAPTPTPTAALPAPTPTPTATPAPTPTPALPVVIVKIGGACFEAELADTPEARYQGLSGREALAPGAAMWFDLGEPRNAAFVMREMRFPLDIVWVEQTAAGLRVAGVERNAPPAPPGTAEAELTHYRSPGPVRYVLEVNAGAAAAHGIGASDAVSASPLQWEGRCPVVQR